MLMKSILFIAIFLSPFLLNAGHCQVIHQEINDLYYQEESSLQAVIKKYLVSALPGIAVGAHAGMICAILDHIVPPLWLLFWVGCYYHRTQLLNDVMQNYKRNHIPHDTTVMEFSSLVACWLLHYKTYEIAHGHPPF